MAYPFGLDPSDAPSAARVAEPFARTLAEREAIGLAALQLVPISNYPATLTGVTGASIHVPIKRTHGTQNAHSARIQVYYDDNEYPITYSATDGPTEVDKSKALLPRNTRRQAFAFVNNNRDILLDILDKNMPYQQGMNLIPERKNKSNATTRRWKNAQILSVGDLGTYITRSIRSHIPRNQNHAILRLVAHRSPFSAKEPSKGD